MTPRFDRRSWFLAALLCAAFAAPASAATRPCSPADAAALAPGATKACSSNARTPGKGKARAAKRDRIRLAALTERDLPITMPLTEEEARSALERELSLKVGKHMRAGDYPDEAQRWRWSGTALVEVSVTPEGWVHQVALSRSSGFRVLDERALEVVRRVPRLFVPAQLRGRPQRAVVPIGFHFQRL